jgi:hypothetical protein
VIKNDGEQSKEEIKNLTERDKIKEDALPYL